VVNLEEEYELYAIVFWHFHKIERVYHDVVGQVSNDLEFVRGSHRNVTEVVVPEFIDSFFDAYCSSPKKLRDTFRKATYLFYSGIDIKTSYPQAFRLPALFLSSRLLWIIRNLNQEFVMSVVRKLINRNIFRLDWRALGIQHTGRKKRRDNSICKDRYRAARADLQ
jgi:hypothetical protein